MSLCCHHWFFPQWSTCPLGPFHDLHSSRPHSYIWLPLIPHSMGLWIVLPLISSTFYTTHLVLSHLSNPLLDLYLCPLGETCWNIKKLWNFYPLLVNVHVWTVAPVLGPSLTDALHLTAVKCNFIVLCNLHTREMLLSLPAAAAAHCSSVLLLCHCSAAQVQLVGVM